MEDGHLGSVGYQNSYKKQKISVEKWCELRYVYMKNTQLNKIFYKISIVLDSVLYVQYGQMKPKWNSLQEMTVAMFGGKPMMLTSQTTPSILIYVLLNYTYMS